MHRIETTLATIWVWNIHHGVPEVRLRQDLPFLWLISSGHHHTWMHVRERWIGIHTGMTTYEGSLSI
jgi:hypothetical protein